MHLEPESMHREPEVLEVHAFCGTGDENIMPTSREAGARFTKLFMTEVIHKT